MSLRIFTFVLFCVKIVCPVLGSVTQTTQAIKSNVLIIFVDDMRHLTEAEVYLPNIRKLAGKGIHFRNAFAQVNIYLIILL